MRVIQDLYAFSVSIGDFEEIRPSIIVRTTDDLTEEQDEAAQGVGWSRPSDPMAM